MKDINDFEKLLPEIFAAQFILASLSNPQKGVDVSKVTIRPIDIKGKLHYQITQLQGEKALHSNFIEGDCREWVKKNIGNFKQGYFYTDLADYHLLINKKGNFTILKKQPTKSKKRQSHNRQKEYVLEEGIPIPFMVHLGLMNFEGKVYPAKMDKFRQINRFLEMIEDILPHLDHSRTIQIVDFGCGKAYLTFALYHFLKVVNGYDIHMIGLDLKSDVIQLCHDLAQALDYQNNLQFIQGDINKLGEETLVDLVISLHACDTATDAALEKAIRWNAKVILCVPCCQHELMHQIEQEALTPLLKHGILKERFAALVTDAARAQLLELLGYQTQIMEFIDLEHTPKNLLIRAIKRIEPNKKQKENGDVYLKFKETLHINPSLEKRFQKKISSIEK